MEVYVLQHYAIDYEVLTLFLLVVFQFHYHKTNHVIEFHKTPSNNAIVILAPLLSVRTKMNMFYSFLSY